jgi:hypothetical protein
MSDDLAPPSPALDPRACPRCGQSNACSQAQGAAPDAPCWCRTLRVPRSLSDPGQPGWACFCADCVKAAQAEEEEAAATRGGGSVPKAGG